ncbi:hypothetical protein HK405_005528, partial [Cladochytrium tenue]
SQPGAFTAGAEAPSPLPTSQKKQSTSSVSTAAPSARGTSSKMWGAAPLKHDPPRLVSLKAKRTPAQPPLPPPPPSSAFRLAFPLPPLDLVAGEPFSDDDDEGSGDGVRRRGYVEAAVGDDAASSATTLFSPSTTVPSSPSMASETSDGAFPVHSGASVSSVSAPLAYVLALPLGDMDSSLPLDDLDSSTPEHIGDEDSYFNLVPSPRERPIDGLDRKSVVRSSSGASIGMTSTPVPPSINGEATASPVPNSMRLLASPAPAVSPGALENEAEYRSPGFIKPILRRESCPENLDQLGFGDGRSGLPRTVSQPHLHRSDSGKTLSFHEKLEQVCLFSALDSPVQIGLSPRTEFIVGSESEESDDDNVGILPNRSASPTSLEETKVLPWRLLQVTAPTTHKLSSGANLAVDYMRLDEDTPGILVINILVRNLSFEKRITVRYTVDGWKTAPAHEADASFVTTISSSTGGVVGIDKFVAKIDLDKEAATAASTAADGAVPVELLVELAVRAEMAGTSFWDSNGGLNHRLQVRRMKRSPGSTTSFSSSSSVSAAAASSSSSSSSASARRRSFSEADGMPMPGHMGGGGSNGLAGAPAPPHRASAAQIASAEALARASAAVVAAEAARIARDFDAQLRRTNSDSGTARAGGGSGGRAAASPKAPVASGGPSYAVRELATMPTASPSATSAVASVRSPPPSGPPGAAALNTGVAAGQLEQQQQQQQQQRAHRNGPYQHHHSHHHHGHLLVQIKPAGSGSTAAGTTGSSLRGPLTPIYEVAAGSPPTLPLPLPLPSAAEAALPTPLLSSSSSSPPPPAMDRRWAPRALVRHSIEVMESPVPATGSSPHDDGGGGGVGH